jgi:hypothetical protein
MNAPVLDLVLDGRRHRKWVIPAIRYADGGARSERWIYCVGEQPYAVTFTMQTGRYPEGCGSGVPCGLDEAWHRAEAETASCSCIFLDGMPCRSDGFGLDADEWYMTQPKDAEGFVADADVFLHLRDLYAVWSTP